MHHTQTAKKWLKDKCEKPTVMVHAEYINKIKTLPLPTEEHWMQDTSEDHDIGYTKKILSSPYVTTIYPN